MINEKAYRAACAAYVEGTTKYGINNAAMEKALEAYERIKRNEPASRECRTAFEYAYAGAWEPEDFNSFDGTKYNVAPDTDLTDPYSYNWKMNDDWIAFQKGWYAKTGEQIEAGIPKGWRLISLDNSIAGRSSVMLKRTGENEQWWQGLHKIEQEQIPLFVAASEITIGEAIFAAISKLNGHI